jgi:hypothetical protein
MMKIFLQETPVLIDSVAFFRDAGHLEMFPIRGDGRDEAMNPLRENHCLNNRFPLGWRYPGGFQKAMHFFIF